MHTASSSNPAGGIKSRSRSNSWRGSISKRRACTIVKEESEEELSSYLRTSSRQSSRLVQLVKVFVPLYIWTHCNTFENFHHPLGPEQRIDCILRFFVSKSSDVRSVSHSLQPSRAGSFDNVALAKPLSIVEDLLEEQNDEDTVAPLFAHHPQLKRERSWREGHYPDISDHVQQKLLAPIREYDSTSQSPPALASVRRKSPPGRLHCETQSEIGTPDSCRPSKSPTFPHSTAPSTPAIKSKRHNPFFSTLTTRR